MRWGKLDASGGRVGEPGQTICLLLVIVKFMKDKQWNLDIAILGCRLGRCQGAWIPGA